MSEQPLAHRMTPTRAFRNMFAPYRRREERVMAEYQKRDERIQRALEMCDANVRAIYSASADEQESEQESTPAGTPLTEAQAAAVQEWHAVSDEVKASQGGSA
jgi:hypothetical protein